MALQPIEGHVRMWAERTASGRRWLARCECGFGLPKWEGDKPPTNATETMALAKLIRHWQAVAAEFRKAGLPVPYVDESTPTSHPRSNLAG